jgi:hypothetical protein
VRPCAIPITGITYPRVFEIKLLGTFEGIYGERKEAWNDRKGGDVSPTAGKRVTSFGVMQDTAGGHTGARYIVSLISYFSLMV